MRKYGLILFGFLLAVAYSCNGWLDVTPQDEIDEDDLFVSGDGYRHALNGIYYGMADQAMYGEHMTWGIVDALAHIYTEMSLYNMGNVGNIFYYGVYGSGGEPYWDNTDLEPAVEAMWENSYKTVANCNNLIQNISKESPDKFAYREREQKMIWGEALALRAFVQLDMLRLFAPSPAMNPGSTKYIPYVSEYPSYVSMPLTVDSCVNSIIRDLKNARELLWRADSVNDMSTSRRFETSSSDDDFFLVHKRGYRLNYWAATVVLARACLYAQRTDEAYKYAKEVIDFNEKTKAFAYDKYYSVADGDRKLYADIIWGLESVYLTEYMDIYNDLSNPDSWYHTYFVIANLEDIFKGDIRNDVRVSQWMTDMGSEYRFSKYEKYDDDATETKISNNLVPLVRMTEAYYIAAEAIYQTNLDEAKGYLRIVKGGRASTSSGLSLVDLENATTNSFMDVLLNDARREWLGEGQIFYMYKRLNKEIPIEGGAVIPMNKKYVILPIPDSETNIN